MGRLAIEEIPLQVYPSGRSIASLGVDWFVAQTKSHCEMAVARQLAKWNVGYFLPMLRIVTKRPDRGRRIVHTPLFPGYLFFATMPGEFVDFQRNEHICTVIPVADEGRLIRELENLNLALSHDEVKPYDRALVNGARCEVIAGSFRGLQGELIKTENENRFVVLVDMLGRGVELEIDPLLLEPM